MKMNLTVILMAIATLPVASFGKILRPKINPQKDLERWITNDEMVLLDHEDDPNDYRLPKGITPETYKVRIMPFLEEGNFTFKGEVSIKVRVQEPKYEITLHSRGLNITESKVKNFVHPNVNIPIVKVTFDEGRDFLVLKLKKNLAVGKFYTITLKFQGELDDKFFGFYRSSYKGKQGKTQWMAVTQLQPTSAREVFPCFDEPQLKANFTISVARNKEMSSLSNMGLAGPSEREENLPASYVWDHYKETPKMSTYLVAFTVSTFKYKKAKEKNFSVWSREDAINQVDYSLDVGPKLLDIMHEITGIEYELPKMDFIAIPYFEAGAMENWGLITFRESDILYEKNTSTQYNLQNVAVIVAHEISHQWFGNLVTPEWWKYLWLSEGFATYFMYAATGLVETTWRMMDQFVVEKQQTALLMDSLDATHPLTFDVRTPNEILSLFDDISYSKAGSIIRMMEHFLKNDIFHQGLQVYLSSRLKNSVNDIQFFQAMDNYAKSHGVLPENIYIKDIMTTWIYQSGYPLVTVERSYNDGRVKIKQEKFFLKDLRRNEGSSWWIPVTYTTQSSLDFNNTFPKYWMPEYNTSIVIDGLPNNDEWAIFNLQESGFYRVNYDEKNWKLIINYLNSKEFFNIHPINRAQLIDDSHNLARGGYLDYSLALDLTNYLSQETDYIPWYSAYQVFDFLDSHLVKSKEYPKFMRHMVNLIKPQYKLLKFKESPNDDHLHHLSNTNVFRWACKYQHEECLSKATELFSDWKGNNKNTVPVDFRSTVYSVAIAEGGEEEWNFLWDAYKSSTVLTERELILSALGCSKSKVILKSYLEKTISDSWNINKQEYLGIFSAVYSKPEGLDITLDFLITNYEKIQKKYIISALGPIIRGLSSRISSKTQAEKLKSFLMRQGKKLEAKKETAINAEKMLDINMKWMKKYIPVIELWLKEKVE